MTKAFNSRGVIVDADIAHRVRSRLLGGGMTSAMRAAGLSHFALVAVAARLPVRPATVAAVESWLDSSR